MTVGEANYKRTLLQKSKLSWKRIRYKILIKSVYRKCQLSFVLIISD